MKAFRRTCLLATAVMLGCFGPAQPGWSAKTSDREGKTPASVEERRLTASIQDQRKKLEQREQSLRHREIELKTLTSEVEEKLEELARNRSQMQELFDQASEEEANRLRKLSKMYGKMEPNRAARLLADLEEDLAVDILSGMKSKSAGEILGRMERGKAQDLTRRFRQLVPD